MTGFFINSYNHNHNAILRQLTAVAQHDIAHIAHAKAIHQHLAGLHLAVNTNAIFSELNHAAVFGNHNIFLGHAQALRQISMLNQMAELTMHRNKEFGAH